jgi:hypothetical protein
MIYRTCSINRVIAQIYRDFKPSHSGWSNEAIEWIGDAIEIMGVHQGYKQVSKRIKVIDHRAKLPCDLEFFLGVEYKNMRLQRSNATNDFAPFNDDKKESCSCLDNLVCHPVGTSYSLNPNYIHTSFKKGHITVHYKGLETDCDGFPLVPDNAFYREALTWYVIMKMCLRGFKHQIVDFKTAQFEWERTYPKAQNSCNMPDIDDYELFKKTWNGLVRNTNLTNEFFQTAISSGGMFNSAAFPPGSLIESFPILGTNLNN